MDERMDDGRLVRVLKALADPKRLQMVREIETAGELSCGQLADKFTLSQPTISHHMKLLVDAGVLWVRRKARHHFVSLDRPLLDEVAARLPAGSATERRLAEHSTARRAPAKEAEGKRRSAKEAEGKRRSAKASGKRRPVKRAHSKRPPAKRRS
jgi:ArsR family transcriptional regulator